MGVTLRHFGDLSMHDSDASKANAPLARARLRETLLANLLMGAIKARRGKSSEFFGEPKSIRPLFKRHVGVAEAVVYPNADGMECGIKGIGVKAGKSGRA